MEYICPKCNEKNNSFLDEFNLDGSLHLRRCPKCKERLVDWKKLLREKHFLIVKGWDKVQEYLGSKIGEHEAKRLGIQKEKSEKKGRGNKKLYYIPFKAMSFRYLKNRAKIKRLKRSIELIEERMKNDEVLREIVMGV